MKISKLFKNYDICAVNDNGFISGIIYSFQSFKCIFSDPEAILEAIGNTLKILELFVDTD